MKIAKVAVSSLPFAADKAYSYRVPEPLAAAPGMRVTVPFGRGNRLTEGVVLTVEEGDPEGLKEIQGCLDREPIFSEFMLRMAAFLRERCFCAFYDCLHAILPAGFWFYTRNIYRLTEDRSWQEARIRQPDALKILRLLQTLGGQAREEALRELLPEEDRRTAALQYLRRKKWIAADASFRKKTSDKTEKIAVLNCQPEEAMAYAAQRPRTANLQRQVLETLCTLGLASVKDLCYYTGASPATVKRLEALGYLRLEERPVLRCREFLGGPKASPWGLNPEQEACFSALAAQMAQPGPKPALLYGVTGSGKTAVYLKLIDRALQEGKSALLLVPEIALTPQLLSLVGANFGDQVAIQHSSLSAGERYDQWKRIRSGQARVVVGTRSAVFAPCVKLGLLIVDEEQEHSYRSENAPRYDAREVALWRGSKEGALVLFGSATPSIETMFRAKNGEYTLTTLKNRYNGRPLPGVSIVDMRAEVEAGNDLALSRELAQKLEDTRTRGKQTILFLNRRGNSRALVCVQCGQAPRCPRCAERLVYHSANGRMMCHYCGFSAPAPNRCPACGSALKQVGVGTQKVQKELAFRFPDMAIDRMDADTVSAVNTHEKILDHFKNQNIPVLLGTQMVAKGLNLPNVTLVGVLDADLGLYSAGYRAAETTFNMLTQVVGRAGRGQDAGEALIQTNVPNHPVLLLAARQDYDGFYNLEIELRRVQKSPPFGDIVSVLFLGREEQQVLHSAVGFRDHLGACLRAPEYGNRPWNLLGPAPCVVPKINFHFRYRLTLRCRMDRPLRLLLAQLLRQFTQDRQNRGVSAFIEVNGFED